MERLNEIMSRTAQRRQQMPEQALNQQDASSQGPRQKTALTRRPSLPEQSTRAQQPRPSIAPPSMPPERPLTAGNRAEQAPRYPRTRGFEQTQRRNIAERRTVYHQYPQRPSQETQLPVTKTGGHAADYDDLPAEMVQPGAPGDYYETYPAMPPADVQAEWEEDSTSMRYGDWEIEPADRDVTYGRPDTHTAFVAPQQPTWAAARRLPSPQLNSPLATRELSSLPARNPETRPVMARNSYDMRPMQAQPSAPPAAQPVQQEAKSYHRITQPLDPRAIVGMAQHNQQDRVPARKQAQQQQQHLANPAMLQKNACPKCKGAGYLRADVPFGHPNFGKPIACECKEAEKKEKRRQQLLELSDLSAFHNKSFRNFSTRFSGVHPSVQEAFQEAYKFAQDPNGWLVLIGPNGCGKTHLAAAIANQNLSDGAVVLFTVVPDLLAHLRATFAPTSTEAYDQRFSKMREAELLVLDDLGAHQGSPWANEKLFQLLNYRYNSGYPTVITANKQGLATVDERILSRISDTALVTTVVLNGALDYRRQNPRREPLR